MFEHLKKEAHLLQPQSKESERSRYESLITSVTPPVDLVNLLRRSSLQVETNNVPVGSVSIGSYFERARSLSYTEFCLEAPQFKGNKLRITSFSGSYQTQDLQITHPMPLLKELTSKDMFSVYPPSLHTLKLSLC